MPVTHVQSRVRSSDITVDSFTFFPFHFFSFSCFFKGGGIRVQVLKLSFSKRMGVNVLIRINTRVWKVGGQYNLCWSEWWGADFKTTRPILSFFNTKVIYLSISLFS